MPKSRPLVDRLGDWSVNALNNVIDHPALAGGGATVVLFVVARIPTQVFYSEFGVRPEDAGLDSVQVLLQGATAALLISLGVGLVYGLVTPIFIFSYMNFMSPLWKEVKGLWSSGTKNEGGTSSQPDEDSRSGFRATLEAYRKAAHRAVRLAPVFVPVASVIFAIAFLTITAEEDAIAVKAGSNIDPKLMPWKAVPVDIIWTGPIRHPSLPGCALLFYLGENSERVLLFDVADEKTFRIYSKDVELAFPEECGNQKGRS